MPQPLLSRSLKEDDRFLSIFCLFAKGGLSEVNAAKGLCRVFLSNPGCQGVER
jgi:hypothetical protein